VAATREDIYNGRLYFAVGRKEKNMDSVSQASSEEAKCISMLKFNGPYRHIIFQL
jgi:hypothetical protein